MGMELLFSVDTVPIHTAKERGENCVRATPTAKGFLTTALAIPMAYTRARARD